MATDAETTASTAPTTAGEMAVEPVRPQTVAVLQARLGSKRLPGKVLLELGGRPLLAHVAERAALARRIDRVVVATSDHPSDDRLEAFCESRALPVFRGPVDDIVGRVLGAARLVAAELVVRLWCDCPFIDPALLDEGLEAVERERLDYLNVAGLDTERTYPVGLDFEVFRVTLLEELARDTTDPFYREFPADYVAAHRDRLRARALVGTEPLADFGLTIDYPEDLALARKLEARLADSGAPTSYRSLVALLRELDTRPQKPRNVEYREKKAQRA